MAVKLNARERVKQEKARKKAAITTGQVSPYAQKVARKRGGGAVDFWWMWWMSRGATS